MSLIIIVGHLHGDLHDVFLLCILNNVSHECKDRDCFLGNLNVIRIDLFIQDWEDRLNCFLVTLRAIVLLGELN